MAYLRRSIIASSLFVSLASCGPSSSSSNVPDLDAYLTQFEDALCKLEVSCGSMPDVPTCKATVRYDSTEFATLRADISSGKVLFDAGKAGTCIDYVKRIYGVPCTRSALASIDTNEDACNGVVVGSVADGSACFSASECTSLNCMLADTTCSRSRACCAGTCAAKPTPIPAGGDCAAPQPGQACATGTYCVTDSTSGTQTCKAPSKVAGTACASVLDCASPLFCARPSGSATGTCERAAETGAPCNTVGSIGVCNDVRDYCDTTTLKCTPRVAVGAACDATSANCVGYATCLGGTCVAMSTERGACNTTDGPNCLGDLECSPTTFTCGFPEIVSTPCN